MSELLTLLGASGGSGIKPTSIVNGCANNGAWIAGNSTSIAAPSGLKAVALNSAQSANALRTVLSVTGKGAIGALFVQPQDATSRTHRVKITLDGVVIFDYTSQATANTNVFPIIGNQSVSGSALYVTPEWFTFDQSLLIEYASSLAEAAPATIGYKYVLR